MSNDPKKLAKLYEEYIRENLADSSKEEVMDQFIATVMAAMDFTDPNTYAQVVKVLLRYEQKKKERAMAKEAHLSQGDDEDAPYSNSGEELDFSSMYKPSSFEDLFDHLSELRASHSEEILLEDMLNLVSVMKSLKPYMFDTEVPWIGLIDDTLCVSWARNLSESVIIAFLEGLIQLEVTHKDEYSELLLDDDGGLEEHLLIEVLREVQDVT